jgi:transcriptional regulator with XRE-family HTH domain
MPRETVTTFPARLAELREARGLTMQQLAEKAGTSLYSVSKLERGERAPSFFLAVCLARALGISLDDFLTRPRKPAPERTSGRPKKS